VRWPSIHRRCDAHLEELKKEWSKERDIMLAWIEQLQLQVGALAAPRDLGPQQPDLQAQALAMYVGDEEEQLLDAHASGLITDEQLEAEMAALGRTQVNIG
jgi:hypothetical protein